MRNVHTKNRTIDDFTVRSVILIRHKIKVPGYKLQQQFHPGHEIIYVDYGKIHLYINEQQFLLQTGDLFIIPSNTKHRFEGEQGRPFDFLNIVFRGQVADELRLKVIQLIPEERRIMHILKEESEIRGHASKNMRLLKLNEILILLTRRQIFPITKMEGDNRIHYQNTIVNKTLSLLYENLSKPLNVAELAHHAMVSDSHLRRVILKATGMSLRQHLRKMRLDYAKRLLHGSANNIDEIAYKTGYRSAPHFCTIFKREVKMTPSEYAKSLG